MMYSPGSKNVFSYQYCFLTNYDYSIGATGVFQEIHKQVLKGIPFLTKLHCRLLFLSTELVFFLWLKLKQLTFYVLGLSISPLHLTNAFICYSIDYPMCTYILEFLIKRFIHSTLIKSLFFFFLSDFVLAIQRLIRQVLAFEKRRT